MRKELWDRQDENIARPIPVSGYRARQSPSLCHTVTSSYCCLAPWVKTQCCSFFICSSRPSLFRCATTFSSLWGPRYCCLGMFIWFRSENVADELSAPTEDLLTHGIDVSPLVVQTLPPYATRLLTLVWMWLLLLEIRTRSSTESRSSRKLLHFHLMLVFPCLVVFLISQSTASRKKTQTCKNPV